MYNRLAVFDPSRWWCSSSGPLWRERNRGILAPGTSADRCSIFRKALRARALSCTAMFVGVACEPGPGFFLEMSHRRLKCLDLFVGNDDRHEQREHIRPTPHHRLLPGILISRCSSSQWCEPSIVVQLCVSCFASLGLSLFLPRCVILQFLRVCCPPGP